MKERKILSDKWQLEVDNLNYTLFKKVKKKQKKDYDGEDEYIYVVEGFFSRFNHLYSYIAEHNVKEVLQDFTELKDYIEEWEEIGRNVDKYIKGA